MSENVIITKAARRKMVQARAGEKSLPAILGVAFGNGGIDEDGTVISPTNDMEALRNEIYRKKVDGYEFIKDTVCRYTCTLSEMELAGEEISEIGLYDAEGDMICIKSFRRKGKDHDMVMTFTVDDVF